MAKEFDQTRRPGTAFDMRAGAMRLETEAKSLAQMRADCVPPVDMRAAPAAPARGAMQLVQQFDLAVGGIRRRASPHWRAVCLLTAMNADARARHADRMTDAALVLPFTPAHLETAAKYRALVEWREGACMKGQAFDSTGGGGGEGFIDRYIDKGDQLQRVQASIGDEVAMSPRRHMDRGNTRATITVRAVVDKAVLAGIGLGAILESYGWQNNGQNRKALRTSLCDALDRMRNQL